MKGRCASRANSENENESFTVLKKGKSIALTFSLTLCYSGGIPHIHMLIAATKQIR